MLTLVVALALAAADPSITAAGQLLDGPANTRALHALARDNPFAASRDCVDLRVMAVLGAIGDAQGQSEIEAMKSLACSVGLAQPVKWQDGAAAKTPTGNWHYPSGADAKSANARWSWPDGATAKSFNGAWSWPDGATAISSLGRLSPRSSSASVTSVSPTRNEILATACGHAPQVCSELPLVRALDADLTNAVLLSLLR